MIHWFNITEYECSGITVNNLSLSMTSDKIRGAGEGGGLISKACFHFHSVIWYALRNLITANSDHCYCVISLKNAPNPAAVGPPSRVISFLPLLSPPYCLITSKMRLLQGTINIKWGSASSAIKLLRYTHTTLYTFTRTHYVRVISNSSPKHARLSGAHER